MKKNIESRFSISTVALMVRKMIENIKLAIKGIEKKIDFSEQIIDTAELARKYSFRGSPTLLINGEDFENMPSPNIPDLTCRFYPCGLPSAEAINDRINTILSTY